MKKLKKLKHRLTKHQLKKRHDKIQKRKETPKEKNKFKPLDSLFGFNTKKTTMDSILNFGLSRLFVRKTETKDVDIDKEYELIQQKKSKLSYRLRRYVVWQYTNDKKKGGKKCLKRRNEEGA